MTSYRVTGPTAVLGHQPGDVFEADLDPAREARHLERGSLAIEWPSGKDVARPVRPAGATVPRKRRRRSGGAGKPSNGGGK